MDLSKPNFEWQAFFAVVGLYSGVLNLWRFPNLVLENGGGAFVFIYILVTFTLCSCLVIGELIVGKAFDRSLWWTFRVRLKDGVRVDSLSGFNATIAKGLRKVRGAWVLLALLLAAYHLLIGGWLLVYTQGIFQSFLQKDFLLEDLQGNYLGRHMVGQSVAIALHLLLCLLLVGFEAKKYMKRFAMFLFPVFSALFLVLVLKSFSIPAAMSSLKKLFYPHFLDLNIKSFNRAVSHSFLSVGLGIGLIASFGSKMDKKNDIAALGFWTATLGVFVALLSCVLVFPIAETSSFSSFGSEMLFQTLPRFIFYVDNSGVYCLLFYACLYLASVCATFFLMDTIVSNFQDCFFWSKKKSLGFVFFSVFVVSILLAYISSGMSFGLTGSGVLQLLDKVLVDILLPFFMIFLAFFFVICFSRVELEKHFFTGKIYKDTEKLFPAWLQIIKLTPVFLISALLMYLIDYA